jgi:hypothetical protein
MHPALKKGTKNFHSTSNSCGIFVIAFFHGTKIPTVDMKVLVYSNFSQKNSKKMKSPSSMRNERFHPSKCRGKVQKTGEKTLKGLFSNLLIPVAHLFGLM